MTELIKHLIGRHDQQDHDPTKKKKDGAGHSREEHLPPWMETLVGPFGENSKRVANTARITRHAAKKEGIKGRELRLMMNAAVDGERVLIEREREKERKLSIEDNGWVKHQLKENTWAAAGAGGTTALLITAFTRNPNMARAWKKWAQGAARQRPSRTMDKTWASAFRSDKAASSPAFRQRVNEMFSGEFGGLKSEVMTIHRNRSVIKVSGQVRTPDGVLAGSFQRSFSRSGEVHHDILTIQSRHQGTGFAKGFYTQSTREYKRAGFDRVTMLANISVGGYAWARQGYQFAPGTAWATRMMLFAKATSTQMAHSSYRTQDMMRAQLLALTPGASPRDFTRIGRNRTWTDSNGIEHWFGKDLMLNTNWPAIRAL